MRKAPVESVALHQPVYVTLQYQYRTQTRQIYITATSSYQHTVHNNVGLTNTLQHISLQYIPDNVPKHPGKKEEERYNTVYQVSNVHC